MGLFSEHTQPALLSSPGPCRSVSATVDRALTHQPLTKERGDHSLVLRTVWAMEAFLIWGSFFPDSSSFVSSWQKITGTLSFPQIVFFLLQSHRIRYHNPLIRSPKCLNHNDISQQGLNKSPRHWYECHKAHQYLVYYFIDKEQVLLPCITAIFCNSL